MIINCPGCKKRYNVPTDKAGIKFRCKECQSVIDTAVAKLPNIPEIDDADIVDPKTLQHYVIGNKGHVLLPMDKEFIFGRALQSDYLLEDARSSRQHSRLKWNGAAFLLSDMDSRNGTVLNGEMVKGMVPLNDRDVVQIAGERFVYRMVKDVSDLNLHLRESTRKKRTMDTEEIPAPQAMFPQTDFNGSLDKMSVTEICQVLKLGRRSGQLFIVDEIKGKCQLFFNNGDIVSANYSGNEGDTAVIKALKIRVGLFSFGNDKQTKVRNVTKPTDYLLLEAARLNDESD
ncbi:MAG: zinc-ribbon domain-containing protein [Planctomycetes bacterium]|nr:zinc-ribbon domain-containing protein [Planctomycetota bacterium]